MTDSPAQPSAERERVDATLHNVLLRARAMVMRGAVTAPDGWDQHEPEWSAGRYQWVAAFTNEAAAQEVMPVALGPGEKYHAAWVRARHPEDLPKTDLTAARAFVSGATSWQQEFRTIDRDGRLHWFAQSAAIRVVGHGRWEVTSINTDITERKLAEEALRASEQRFRQVTETIDEVFWMTDVEKQRMIYISPAYEKIWGQSCTHLYASPQSWLDAIHPDDRERVRSAAMTMQAAGDYDLEYRIVRPDRVVRWIHDRAFPIKGADGRVSRVVGVAEDITQRRQLEEQFRQSQKMEAIGQLAGGIAHDFNNLLTVVQMQTSLLLNERRLDASSEQSVRQIMDAATRAANLTRQLLTFSRRSVKEARLIDLTEVVTSTTKLLRRVLGEDITLESRFAPGLPLVQADAGMMEQVLMNLVLNARDAMSGGGRLTLRLDAVHAAARPGRFVRLDVSDTGVGIPPENQPRIFEPFFTTKEVGKGTGLGLAMVFGIVQQHQGWIEVESELGHGTSFRVFLPVADRLTEPAPVAAERARGGHETVLLVEDEAAVRAVAAQALKFGGYRVVEAATAAEALRQWDEQKGAFDLLVTDLIMPGGASGQQLAAELRARSPSLRILYTSGYSEDNVSQELRLAPGKNFLPKPYPIEELLAIVRRRLDDAA